MKPSQMNSLPRTIACVAFVTLASVPALHASLSLNLNAASDQNLLQLNDAQQSLNQLSTGLKISSAADNAQSLYIQTSPLQQSVLQLFGGDQNQPQVLQQAGVAQLSLANQSQQNVLQLIGGQSDNSQQSLNQLSTGLRISSAADNAQGLYIQTTPLQQSVLQLFRGDQPQQQVLQQVGVAQLSLANQSQQSVLQLANGQSDNSQQSLSQANSAQDNAAGLQTLQSDNTQQRLSTGLRINQASPDNNGIPSLNQFIKAGMARGLQNAGALQGDPNRILLSSRLTVTACYADQNGQLQILNQASLQTQPQQVLSLLNDSSANQVVAAGDLAGGNQLGSGRKLDFFTLGDAQNSVAQWLNADGFAQNLAEFAAGKGKNQSLSSPYLCFEFHNIWGDGDQLANGDTTLALNLNNVAVNSLLATPEPATALTFAACLGLALLAVRKSKKATV